MRPFIYATLALLLALFGLVGLREATAFRWAAAEREQRLARANLAAAVDQWEASIAERTVLWLTEVGSGPVREREAFLRANVAWFDAFYVWESGEIAHPSASPAEDLSVLRATPCLAQASAAAGTLDNVGAAGAYAACLDAPGPVALLAASEAAELLLNADQPAAAERVFRTLGSRFVLPLRAAPEAGVSSRRLVFLRLQHARALDALGRTDLAERVVHGLLREIAGLDGAQLTDVLELYRWPIAQDLRVYGGPSLGGEDDEALLRAQRRLAVYEEIRDRAWSAADAPPLAQGPRLLVDPYGDPPWILSLARLPDGTLMGVGLDQPELIASFLAAAPTDLRPYLSVRDPAGRLLAGSAAPVALEAAFTRLLPHLRVGLSRGALTGDGVTRALFAQLFPVGLGVLIGGLALLGLVTTDRRQQRLIERQREFMTRVTHELKTPLAGIRLMAENLEMGSFRDDAQRERFARQIVKEAERLGSRLDEVIRAASRPVDEAPERTDVVAMLEALGERWRPLFEQQGASLIVELPKGPTELVARPVLLRDAVTNLLDNALKYRKPSGPAHCWLRLRVERRWLIIDVEDDGIGVPADKRKDIFARFARVEGPGRGRAGGHGLGLSFVADAARTHGGKVECREGRDGGARFLMRIRRRT